MEEIVRDLESKITTLTSVVEEQQKQLNNKVSDAVLMQAISSLQLQVNLKADKPLGLVEDKGLSAFVDGNSFVGKAREQLKDSNLRR